MENPVHNTHHLNFHPVDVITTLLSQRFHEIGLGPLLGIVDESTNIEQVSKQKAPIYCLLKICGPFHVLNEERLLCLIMQTIQNKGYFAQCLRSLNLLWNPDVHATDPKGKVSSRGHLPNLSSSYVRVRQLSSTESWQVNVTNRRNSADVCLCCASTSQELPWRHELLRRAFSIFHV